MLHQYGMKIIHFAIQYIFAIKLKKYTRVSIQILKDVGFNKYLFNYHYGILNTALSLLFERIIIYFY
jgi:hypothetical protein